MTGQSLFNTTFSFPFFLMYLYRIDLVVASHLWSQPNSVFLSQPASRSGSQKQAKVVSVCVANQLWCAK